MLNRYLIVGLSAFFIGFAVAAYWRGLENQITAYEAQISQADALLDAHQKNDALTVELSASSRDHYQKMQEKLHENADLATALAAGRLQLHLAESATEDFTGGSMAAGRTCALNAAGRQTYLDLRAGIIRNEAQIEALQERNRTLEAHGR